jgi:hypothetical protein
MRDPMMIRWCRVVVTTSGGVAISPVPGWISTRLELPERRIANSMLAEPSGV